MKGLLIKDFKLMKVQKNFLLIIAALMLGMTAFSDDVSFTLGFLTLITSLFTLNTISYDEFDNGNAFLFTLPVTRTTYVIEKYILGILLGFGAWILSACVAVTANVYKNTMLFEDIMTTALSILPLMLMIQALMIPFQLKFGGEKGRIAIIGAVGLLFVSGIIIMKIAEAMNIDIAAIIHKLPALSIGMLLAVFIAAALVLLLISVRISISILRKKEF